MSDIQSETDLDLRGGGTMHVLLTKMEPVPAFILMSKLAKVIVPVILAARGGKADDDSAVKNAFDGLTPELADSAMRDILRGVTVTKADDKGELGKTDLNSTANINKAFRGQLGAMFKVIKFALTENFSEVFDVSAFAPTATTNALPNP